MELEQTGPDCGPFFESHSGGNYFTKVILAPHNLTKPRNPPCIAIVIRRPKHLHSCSLQRLILHVNLKTSSCIWCKQNPLKEIVQLIHIRLKSFFCSFLILKFNIEMNFSKLL